MNLQSLRPVSHEIVASLHRLHSRSADWLTLALHEKHRADIRPENAAGVVLFVHGAPDAKWKTFASSPHACKAHGVSQRRACHALNIDRSTVRYVSSRPDDAPLREAMKAVASERRRFGYWRVDVMLDRLGIVVNQKASAALPRGEAASSPSRRAQAGTRHTKYVPVPDHANARWRLDFVSDAFTDGRRFRAMAVIDGDTRERLALMRQA